jgi:nitroreductase
MMRNENNHLKELLLNRRVVRNYLETNEEFPNLSDIPKLTIKIPTAGFSRGIEIISVENKKNIKKLAIYANEESYLKKGYGKWLSNSKAIFLILINEQAYHERYKELDKQNQTSSSNWSVPYWYVDAGAAMMNCMLLVEETGLKSGFLGSHNMEIQKIKSLLGIPEDIEILGFVTAGVEGDSANLKKENLNKKKLLHKEKYAK